MREVGSETQTLIENPYVAKQLETKRARFQIQIVLTWIYVPKSENLDGNGSTARMPSSRIALTLGPPSTRPLPITSTQ